MKITYHAAQRFLERVIKQTTFTKSDITRSKQMLSKLLKDVVPHSFANSFALPGFEKDFFVIHKGNTIVTIIPKRG